MTQVQTMTNPELNRKIAELMGYSVVLRGERYVLLNPNGNRNWHVTFCNDEQEAWLHTPDYCTDPAASMEVQAAALKFNTVEYVRNLAISTWGEAVDEDEVLEWSGIGMDHIGDLLDAKPRERAEAAYITMMGVQGHVD